MAQFKIGTQALKLMAIGGAEVNGVGAALFMENIKLSHHFSIPGCEPWDNNSGLAARRPTA